MPQKTLQKTLSKDQKYLFELLSYADIYENALDEDRLVSFFGVSRRTINKSKKEKLVGNKNGYLFLQGRGVLVNKSVNALKTALDKSKTAESYLLPFARLPWVKMIALSGSIGALNAKPRDDYDVFLVVEKNSKWLVRIFEIFYFGFIKRNRAFKNRPNEKNTICSNVYFELESLEVPKFKRSIFMAYQSVLVLPIYGEDVYAEFLSRNKWVKDYLPGIKIPSKSKKIKATSNPLISFVNFFVSIPQKLKIILGGGNLKQIDLSGKLFFHPEDPTQKILTIYDEKLQKLFKSN